MTFHAMLRQECGWFDDQNNSVGALGSRLSGDASNLQTVTDQMYLDVFLDTKYSFLLI